MNTDRPSAGGHEPEPAPVNQSDHDLLIRVDEKMDGLARRFDTFESRQKEHHEGDERRFAQVHAAITAESEKRQNEVKSLWKAVNQLRVRDGWIIGAAVMAQVALGVVLWLLDRMGP